VLVCELWNNISVWACQLSNVVPEFWICECNFTGRLGSSPSLKGLKIAMHASGQKKGAKIWEKSRERRTWIPCKRAKFYRRIFHTEAWLASWEQQQIFVPIFASNIRNAANVPSPSLLRWTWTKSTSQVPTGILSRRLWKEIATGITVKPDVLLRATLQYCPTTL
jgi:hypothetical protein